MSKTLRDTVRLSFAERRALAEIMSRSADRLEALPYRDQPTLEGYTLRATERGFCELLHETPVSEPGPSRTLASKMLDALDRLNLLALPASEVGIDE